MHYQPIYYPFLPQPRKNNLIYSTLSPRKYQIRIYTITLKSQSIINQRINMSKQTESNNSQTIITHIDIPSNNTIHHHICTICQINFDESQTHPFGKCMHFFCNQCTRLYIDSQITQGKLIKCPQENCSSILNQESVLITSLPQQKQRKYYRIQKRSKNPTISFCSSPNCLGDLTLNPKFSNCFGILSCLKGLLQCNTCSAPHCSNCLLLSHQGDCLITDKSRDHEMAKNLQQNYLFRRCKRCSMMVQKNEGCDHMTCKCRFQFCYTCGRDYTVHTCTYVEESHEPILTRIVWSCVYLISMLILFPVDILFTVLLFLTPISALVLVIPLALIIGLVKMKEARCSVILMGNVFLFLAYFLHSIPKAFDWYWRNAVPMWLSAVQYCHFTFFCFKITTIFIYRLPIPCNNRDIVAPQIQLAIQV